MSSTDILSAPLPTTILVVRHAEVHNPKDILYGRLPRFHLSTRGKEQAEMGARFLAARPIAAMYTSPLLRARQTAHILTHYQANLVPRTSRLLIEVRTSYQGSPNSILTRDFSFYEPKRDPDDESMQDVFDRMLRFLLLVARRHAGKTVVAVSHADPIAIMRLGLEDREFSTKALHSTVYPGRASVNQIRIAPEEETSLVYFEPASDAST